MRSRSPLPADDQSKTPGVTPVKPKARSKGSAKPAPEPADAQPTPAAHASDVLRRPVQVLIVDDEPTVREALVAALGGQPVDFLEAGTIAEARELIANARVDLALLDVKLPDGDGVSLADELRSSGASIESIVMTGKPSVKRAVQAMRAGACDFISKPFDLEELNRCVAQAMQRRADQSKDQKRIVKLKRLCRKLNRARHEVTQQVDILCNDLVTAYQELAGQMRHVQMTTQFQTTIEQELDLEQVLRRALEYVLQHVGPTNAVVFLPGREGAHTVGGYINYTFDKPTADVLLSHLGDVAAPRIGEADGVIHLSDDSEINLWLSDDSAWLSDCQVLAMPCRNDEDEVMANLMLFRDVSEPFTEAHAETIEAMAPIFAQQLLKVIGIHHRVEEDEQGDDWDDDEVPF